MPAKFGLRLNATSLNLSWIRCRKSNRHFQTLYSQTAQQLCRSVYESFASFKQLNTLYQRGELLEKPRPPKYRKNGLNSVSYPKQGLRLIEDGQIRIPLGQTVKVWFKLDSFTLTMPSNLKFESIRGCLKSLKAY